MTPVVLAAQLLEILFEESAHGDDTIGHVLDLAQPLLVQGRVVKNLGCNASTVNRWVGVKRSHEDLDLRINALLLFNGLAHHGESTDTLAVKTLIRSVSLLHYNTC